MTLTEFLEARIGEDEHMATMTAEAGGVTIPFNESVAGGPFDPVRVLREVAAKRAIIAKAREWDGDPNDYGQFRSACELLAEVYADHPDYDEAWRP